MTDSLLAERAGNVRSSWPRTDGRDAVTVFVLDSSSVLRYIDDEAGGDRVNAIFKECVKHRRGCAFRLCNGVKLPESFEGG